MMEENLTFQVAHVGLNFPEAGAAAEAAARFAGLFGLVISDGNSSLFAGPLLELMKAPGPGQHGHIAVAVSDLPRARAMLESQGVAFDEAATKFDAQGNMLLIYLREEIGGFAVHLLQKKER